MFKKTPALLLSAALLASSAAPVFAQVAGGVMTSVQVNALLAQGWSAKHTILGQPVYDEKSTKIGDIDDILIDKTSGAAQPLAGVGGFLGIGEHYVAIDTNALKTQDKKLVWSGATKDAVKALPAVDRSKLPANEISLKKSLLGASVHNAKKETVGKVEDVIIAPDKHAYFAILSAGSYLAMDKHDVAIPVSQFKFDGDVQLPNATKDELRALPAFNYSK
ncbi:MAG: PRC-barrel domain-containing protein [Hyphomicrobiales bacterium]|nr:PRC-barrel domain-containing protein [Hyphomicrobiales bacterium]